MYALGFLCGFLAGTHGKVQCGALVAESGFL